MREVCRERRACGVRLCKIKYSRCGEILPCFDLAGRGVRRGVERLSGHRVEHGRRRFEVLWFISRATDESSGPGRWSCYKREDNLYRLREVWMPARQRR